jgi:predicted ArsR family transcriptional regulator
MNAPRPQPDDVLAYAGRARLFEALVALRRPASTAELARLVGRHPNTTRTQLRRLADAGLVECRRIRRARGRPRSEWVVAPDARPAGEQPEAHAQLARWLARAIGARDDDLAKVEQAGREIGRELAPAPGGRSAAAAMTDALAALGFAPGEEPQPGGRRYVLGNCPYRDAVRENQPAVCTLHRGITRGLLDKLDPRADLRDFVARDPDQAGCLIDVGLSASTA